MFSGSFFSVYGIAKRSWFAFLPKCYLCLQELRKRLANSMTGRPASFSLSFIYHAKTIPHEFLLRITE